MRKLFSLLSLIVLFSCSASKMTQEDLVVFENKLNGQTYEFVATMAMPLGGKNINLTSTYNLRITKDSVISYLPYYGRAYSAPYGGDGGIKFVSTKFDYNLIQKKKDGWDVVITTKDTSTRYDLYLSIFPTGTSSLNVRDSNRQPITFFGNIN